MYNAVFLKYRMGKPHHVDNRQEKIVEVNTKEEGWRQKKTNPQCTLMDSLMSKESVLWAKVGYPPKSEPPNSVSLLKFSSYM